MSDPPTPTAEWFADETAAKVLPLQPMTARERALVRDAKVKAFLVVAAKMDEVAAWVGGQGIGAEDALRYAAKGLRTGVEEVR